MDRTIHTPIAPATLAIAETLLAATWTANAAEPYVAADYDAAAAALAALLTAAFGKDGDAVREATYDGNTVAQAVEHVQRDSRASAADAYDMATAQQAETDALRAFDRIVEGWAVEHNLRTFAAATDHLAAQGCYLFLEGMEPTKDADGATARALAAANLVVTR